MVEFDQIWFYFSTCSLPCSPHISSSGVAVAGGGGGGGSICMHIGYVPRERPTFSALNFHSGAYHFHKFPKYLFQSITILHFLADFAVPETIIYKNFFNFNTFIASHGLLSPRVSGRSGDSHFHAQNGSSSFQSPAFSSSKRLKLVPEPRIFKLKTAQARSRAPHFHDRPGARSGDLAAAHTVPTKIWGEYPPPPPPPGCSAWISMV